MQDPQDAEDRRAVEPVICYPPETLPTPTLDLYANARHGAKKVAETIVSPREADCIEVPAGCFLKLTSIEGPQVGDLNLFNSKNLDERFYSGKTRALHGTHVTNRRPALVQFSDLASSGDRYNGYA